MLGDFAADLAHIVPELSRRLRIQPSERTGDPEEDRYRLQRAVAAALRAIATRQPLLLIVEDLHDADPGTVDLLIHLSRHLSRARLLVVVTYRDTELAPPHRSAAVLTELQRAPSFDHISLRGLTARRSAPPARATSLARA